MLFICVYLLPSTEMNTLKNTVTNIVNMGVCIPECPELHLTSVTGKQVREFTERMSVYKDVADNFNQTMVVKLMKKTVLYNCYVKSFPNKQGMSSYLSLSSFKAISINLN